MRRRSRDPSGPGHFQGKGASPRAPAAAARPTPPVWLGIVALVGIAGLVASFSILYPEVAKVLVIVGVVLLVLGVLIGWGSQVWDMVYPRWRMWQADHLTLREKQIVRLTPDGHGFGGVVVDLEKREWRDLDTGEGFRLSGRSPPDPFRAEANSRQRQIAALTGAVLRSNPSSVVEGPLPVPEVTVAGLGNAGPWLQLDEPSESNEIVQV